ncbi:pyruvate kinase [Paraferrimonas sedimenticola]|uniref:Pyruvate kinase n=1 Tax=Paraferrimonas sedimenticola TaxID=375674 RepID=A0AA37RYU4_9GAMM|nr:pyruvate kinase [Paraferrimonas sedimenticola]GLP97956.1 pyruvate kinase [Paraferrimonas sedimenticola]
MFRRTKIVSTLGPATDDPQVLEQLLTSGVNVVRMNFSHGKPEDHLQRAQMVRELASKLNLHVAILGDLQGPKIRVSTFANNKITLKPEQDFVLDAELAPGLGDEQQVGIDYKQLPQDLVDGDWLMLDDGRVQLQVTKVDGQRIHTKVKVAGPLSNNKGINKKGGGLSAPALTDKDKADIVTAANIDVDFLAVSFPRSGDDLRYARELAQKAGLDAMIVSKVERAETVTNLDTMEDIILASDAVMVARGDLGVEIGDPELVGVQKKLISRCRQLDRPVITATQMMESMIDSPMPTRAEVMDVANAVLDGTDAVMLSAETAAGKYPVETVQAMSNVCLGAESHPTVQVSKHRITEMFDTVEETIAFSAMYAANHMPDVKAIVALTESGRTALLMSRITSKLPIFGLSRHQASLNQMALYRGVMPVEFDTTKIAADELAKVASETLKEAGFLNSGDTIIMTKGDAMETIGGTNTLKIVRIP